HIRVPQVLIDELVRVKVVVWNVENMLRLARPRIRGAIAPNIHASLLRQPCPIRHRESLPYPVLQQSAIPAASADLVDAHVDEREGCHFWFLNRLVSTMKPPAMTEGVNTVN